MANEIMSVEGQLVGMPLAGPESFSQQQLDYLRTALGLGTWTDVSSEIAKSTTIITGGSITFRYNKAMKLISLMGEIHVQGSGDVYTLPEKYRPQTNFTLANPDGTSFIDYTTSTGKFVARSGTNGYFSWTMTMPCLDE